MRFIPVLLISVALATSAGCFGKDDPPATTTPTPTGATTPTTGATPTTTPTSPTPGDNTTTPPKPAPREVHAETQTFQNAPSPDPTNPTGATNPTVTRIFSVPAAYTKLTLNVTWSSTAPGGVGGASTGISIVVSDAAGTAVATCAGPGQGPQPSVPAPCTAEGPIMAATAATDYSITYSGSGTFQAAVSIVASA